MSRIATLARSGLFFAALAIASAARADGDLDTTFGDDGYAIVPGLSAQGPQSVIAQGGGRLVHASRRYDGSAIVVGAMRADGSIDAGFASGFALTVPAIGVVYSPRLAVDPTDGKTLLAYTDFQAGVYRFVLCRIAGDGTLDATFAIQGHPSQGGCVRMNTPAGAPNGIVVAGLAVRDNGVVAFGGTAYDFGAAAIGKPFHGSYIPGIGLAATVLTTPGDVVINAFALNADTDVRYLAGTIQAQASGQPTDFAPYVVRADGVNATTAQFNQNLVANGNDDARALAVLPNGRVVVAATLESPGQKTTCLVLGLDGATLAPDTNFGPNHDGRKPVMFGGDGTHDLRCDVLSFDAGINRLYVAGRFRLSREHFAVARLSPVGQNDVDFGFQGNNFFNSAGLGGVVAHERAIAATLQNGRLVLAGPSEDWLAPAPATSRLMLVRMTSSDLVFADGFE